MRDKVESNEILRLNVKFYRITKGYTQKEISEKLKVNEKHYSQLENGYYNYTLENLDIVADLFDKEPWELLKERHNEDEVPNRVDIYKNKEKSK